jgi:hypothetical protein
MSAKRTRLVAVIEKRGDDDTATIVARRTTSESVDDMLLTATGVLLFATYNLLAAAIATTFH